MTNLRLLSRLFLLFSFFFTAAALPAQEESAAPRPQGAERRQELPLKPDRKIEFSTDEATWLSLDVSPDGKTIVFELLGDIYAVPIAGGEAKAIVTGMAFDSQPRFSPDGKWIAFISDRDGSENVWIAKADGSEPKKISRDTDSEFASPSWSPDGQYVIASRSSWGLRVYEVWMYHIKGGSGVQITRARATPTTPQNQRQNSLGAVFSPDGRFLYFARRTGGFQYNAQLPLWQIARRDMDSGEEDNITGEIGSGMRPLLSPDGKWLVYATRHEIQTGLRIRNLASGEDNWLKYPVTRDDQESRFTRDFYPGYAFTPDGNDLIVTFDGKIQRINLKSRASTTIPFTAQVSQQLGPRLYFPQRVDESPMVRSRLLQTPAQSPDGKKLVFSAFTHLYLTDLPSSAAKRLTSAEAGEFQPAWSSDGQWIAYVTWTSSGGHIWKIRGDGSATPVQLTKIPAYYTDPVFSADGQRIVALRSSRDSRIRGGGGFGGAGGRDLIWIPAAGGDANLVVPARGVGSPHFTDTEPDRIYVYSNQGLISLRYDGTDRKTHIRVTGPGNYNAEGPVPASDIRVSPDGQWVLAHVGNQLYLTALPRVGGEAPTVTIRTPIVPLKKITDVGADYFDWADGGKTITWAVGPSFFRQPVSTITFDPPRRPEGAGGTGAGGPRREGAAAPPVETPAPAAAPPAPEKKPDYQEFPVVVEVPRHTPKGSIVFRGAKAITMKGDEVIEDSDIVVTDNRIVAVGKRGAVQIPAGAKIQDVKGNTIIPGMIDTHAHWGEVRRGILETDNWSFLANLAYGVTAGLDVQTGTNDAFAYQDMIDAGISIGLRNYSTGPGVFSNNAFTSEDEVKGVLKKYRDYYRTTHIKSYIVGNRRQRQWMVMACKELGMMPTTEGGLDQKLNLTHILDGFKGNEHALPLFPLYKDTTRLVAESGLFYTPTLLVIYGGPWSENFYYENTEVHDDAKLNRFTPHSIVDAKTRRRPQWFRKDEYIFPQTAKAAAGIVRAGGRVGVGAHGQLQGLGYHWELWSLQSGGMTNLEALRAATLHGAEALALAQDLGSLEPGKLADLVILFKDPLTDIHNTNTIRFVMKNGELFEGDTLNQLWPVQKPLPALWWWSDKP